MLIRSSVDTCSTIPTQCRIAALVQVCKQSKLQMSVGNISYLYILNQLFTSVSVASDGCKFWRVIFKETRRYVIYSPRVQPEVNEITYSRSRRGLQKTLRRVVWLWSGRRVTSLNRQHWKGDSNKREESGFPLLQSKPPPVFRQLLISVEEQRKTNHVKNNNY